MGACSKQSLSCGLMTKLPATPAGSPQASLTLPVKDWSRGYGVLSVKLAATQSELPRAASPTNPLLWTIASLSMAAFDWALSSTDSDEVCREQVKLPADVLFIWYPSECLAHGTRHPSHHSGDEPALGCVASVTPSGGPQPQPSVSGVCEPPDDSRHSFGVRPPDNARTKVLRFPRVRLRPSTSWFRLWAPGL